MDQTDPFSRGASGLGWFKFNVIFNLTQLNVVEFGWVYFSLFNNLIQLSLGWVIRLSNKALLVLEPF